ncbi:MAG: 2-amino-4-hydroxy-6-hydroxymethyldihydropteridine diphosphokinase [Candidatus Omnitrophica bacterium]|nr:2-amino-4-hydroxy-6-hydroxymethyldihydropteridine diphosphokinase [Candidatus Omnitrophota bacterium]
MARVFIGIGSNEGDRLSMISQAVQRLGNHHGIRVVQMALVSETEPVGLSEQPDFLNTVVEIETTLSPHALLSVVKCLEQQLGRVPSSQRWGPRPIDLDILLYDDRVVQEPHLTIPHAQMHQRRFVLEPLAQLAPDAVHPVLKQTIEALLDNLVEVSSRQ